jgi:hypothetical protein
VLYLELEESHHDVFFRIREFTLRYCPIFCSRPVGARETKYGRIRPMWRTVTHYKKFANGNIPIHHKYNTSSDMKICQRIQKIRIGIHIVPYIKMG